MYVYVCNACLDDDHEHCEVNRDIPSSLRMAGGGHCICQHKAEPQSEFERITREASEKTRWP